MKRNMVIIYFLLAALEGVICGVVTLSIESSAKTALNYSPARLLLAAGIFSLSIAFLALAARSWARPAWVESLFPQLEDDKIHSRTLRVALFLFVLVGALSLLPGYWFREYAAFWDRLRPSLTWLACMLGQSAAFLAALKWTSLRASVSALAAENKSLLRVSAGILVFFLAAWILIALTRVGITPDLAAWNEAGVPLLGLQIHFALLVSLGIAHGLTRWQRTNHLLLKKTFGKISVVDALLCLAIWALAAGLWLAEPIPHSFNAPRPSPPNYEYYPYSDAAAYDVGGQYILIGQGVNNDLLTDKPFYMFLLGLFHAIGGQSYTAVMAIQALVLAAFPVLLYLLGKEMHSRGAGILIALFAIFKERNAIASALDIQVSHSKLMLTEMPTALAISLFALLLFLWLKHTPRPRALPLWAGGVLGVAVLIRPNPLLLLPFGLLAAWMVYGRGWRRGVIPVILLVAGFALVVSPWLLTNRDAQGRTYIQVKIDGIMNRYKWQFPGESVPTPEPQGGTKPVQLATLPQASLEAPRMPVRAAPASRPREAGEKSEGQTTLEFVPAHFLHNEVAGLLILPLTWKFQNLEHTLALPFWNRYWAGSLTRENGLLLCVNLGLIALGLGLAWRRWRVAGLVPVFVQSGYFLANALARTSGSRYLVPVDWAIYFYFGLGLFQLAQWILSLAGRSLREKIEESSPLQPEKGTRLYWIAPAIILLALGSLLPLAGALPERYPPQTKKQAFEAFQRQVSPSDLGLDAEKIDSFLKNPKSVVFQGRALYPRFLMKGEGLCTRCYVLDAAFQDRPFPRLAFLILGPDSAGVFIGMDELPKGFRNSGFSDAADVWVIGCTTRTKAYRNRLGGSVPVVRGIAIVVTGENGTWIYKHPHSDLECK